MAMQMVNLVKKAVVTGKRNVVGSIPWFDNASSVDVLPIADEALLDGMFDPDAMTRQELQVWAVPPPACSATSARCTTGTTWRG